MTPDYIANLMRECQRLNAENERLQRVLESIAEAAAEELARIEQHGGVTRFPSVVEAIARKALP